MIRNFVSVKKQDWDEHIGLLLAAYWSTPHSATCFTPNMMMLGREINLPVDILYPLPKSDEPTETTVCSRPQK